MGRIVVGVDGSEGGARALRFAVREAGLRSWDVAAVLSWGWLDQHHPDGSSAIWPDYAEADATAALAAYVAEALGGEHHPVDLVVVNDLAAAGLLGAARHADLLVVGARGLGGFRGVLLGSVSQTCLHHATCPVAVVRPAPERAGNDVERIVVGLDGSPGSDAALAWALDEARARRATVDAVHVWHGPAILDYPLAVPLDTSPYERAARELLDGAVQHADTHGLVRPVERILTTGGATGVLLDVATGADLVVVGSHGTGGFTGMLVGSTSLGVARHAPCPVVVVPRNSG
jgi:nucleotide-binding universal stress UspA family protein